MVAINQFKRLAISTKVWFPVFAIAVGILCWGTTWRIILQSQRSVLGATTNLSSSQIIALTNLQRVSEHVSPLSPNDSLSQAAQLKLNDMLAKGYFDHLDPEGVGSWQFIDQTGYTYHFAGENLARNFSSSVDVINAWMESAGHRENILNPNYTHIGVAIAEKGTDVYIVQLFATPLPVGTVRDDSRNDHAFYYSTPLIGKYLLSDNYFLSSLLAGLGITLATGLMAWLIGRKFIQKIRAYVPKSKIRQI